MKTIKILIVEDDPLISEDIRELLTQANYQVIGVVHSKEDALSLLDKTLPDLALLDINLGGNTDGITIAETINEAYKIPFLFLTSYSSKLILDKVKHTLPMGYIVKPFDEGDLVAGIEIAISNFNTFNKTELLSLEVINKSISNPLTQKEFEILKAIYKGNSNKDMAETHFISVNTVKTHVQKVYEKLDAHSRPEAIVKIRSILKN